MQKTVRKVSVLFVLVAFVAFCASLAAQQGGGAPAGGQGRGGGGGGGRGGAPPLLMTTTAFEDGGVIPDKYTQASQNAVSPALKWSQVPMGTQSFVLLL